MAALHGHRQAAAARRRAPAWDDLPGNMQLLVVKEMTSWQSYMTVINDRLQLTRGQKRRFETLYHATMCSQILTDGAASAAAAEVMAIQEQQQHHSGAPGREGSISSVAGGRNYQLVGALRKDRMLLTQAVEPFPVMQRDLARAQAFLRGIGFVRRAADLGHWLGHSGSDRFVIDEDTHGVCAVGTHVAPDAETAPPRLFCSLPVPVPTPEQGTSQAESPSVPVAVPLLQVQQRRRGRPRRVRPLSDTTQPSRDSRHLLQTVGQNQNVESKEDVAVPVSGSPGDRTGTEETGVASAPQPPPIATSNATPEELVRADRINREAQEILARYRSSFGRQGRQANRANREKTEDSDEDYIGEAGRMV